MKRLLRDCLIEFWVSGRKRCASDLVFTSAVAADSKQAQAAKAFIDFLHTPEATAVIKAKGMKAG